MDERLARIKEKIGRKRLHLETPLTEGAIQEFERKHSVRLPEDYRQFLSNIGASGDGPPVYGLVSPGTGPRDAGNSEREIWEQLPYINQTFPFTQSWVWEDDDESAEGTIDKVSHGSIFLGNDGCGQYWHLIVTGGERGKIWLFTGEGITPLDPSRDFLEWYEFWLDGGTNWWG